MITYPDCYPCLLRQSVEAIQLTDLQADQQNRLIKRILQVMGDEPLSVTPVRLTAVIHRLIQSKSGIEDLYRNLKEKSNRQAMCLLSEIYHVFNNAEDRLLTAAKFAIAGNIIDYGGTGIIFDLEKTLAECQTLAFGIDDFERMRTDLAAAKRVVYVGDNAGEIVFDRLFMEEIKKFSALEIVYIVRGRPILNDVTLEDARLVGIPDVARVVSSGGDGPGCELDRVTPEVLELFQTADLIISKGQGNYEALSDQPYPIYFLLKVKCSVIAGDIGAHKGDSVVKFSAGKK
jgi:uncharacterized protein with ATP-grasp and redox domains